MQPHHVDLRPGHIFLSQGKLSGMPRRRLFKTSDVIRFALSKGVINAPNIVEHLSKINLFR
jgi:hypothetical protein